MQRLSLEWSLQDIIGKHLQTDNSQTKSDKKDALTIAKLVKDGRYFELYLPHDIYAELRGLSTTRSGLNKRKTALKNTIKAVMDEFFSEYEEVFKHPRSGKASRHILKNCPFPKFIVELGKDGMTAEIKKAVSLIHTLAKKKESYDPDKVFGSVRREQMKAAD